jgi:predicted ATPase/DNA-binding XRE family transcriptional regulator
VARPTFGELLREFRIRAGLSQGDLAEKPRLSEAAIGTIERGIRKGPHRSTIALLAKALDLNREERAALENARDAVRSTSRKAATSHNLRAERTSFVGREADVAEILKLLHRSRLVTVTGSGGVGKTRAVLEAARQALGEPFEEAWFADLAPLVDGDDIPAKIASSIRPALSDHAESIEALASAIPKRRMLLILDNCEHVVGGAAEVTDALLENCPLVSILATSRERLNVAGEFVYRLPSLAPDAACDLFVQRAQAAGQHVSFDATQVPLVAAVVQRLDGIPLAIELIAAQLSLLGLEPLQARLNEEFRIPAARRNLPARQQTVVATIQWSYQLLSAGEQALLTAVSIFAGGFTLGGAEAVCANGAVTRSEIAPLVLSVANKSLINVESTGTTTRYSLLESVRSFGLERLYETGSHDDVARRHAQWLAVIADDVEANAHVSEQRAAELLPELDNVRAAVAWSLKAEREEDRILAVRILTGLTNLWDRVGRNGEHGRLVETAIGRIDERQYPVAASNLHRERIHRAWQEPNATELIECGVAVGENSRDQVALAKILVIAAQALTLRQMDREANAYIERAADLSIANGRERTMLHADVLVARAQLRLLQGRLDEARCDVEDAEHIALALGHRYYVVCYVNILRADVEYASGNKRLAQTYVERIMESEFAADSEVGTFALVRASSLRLQLGDVDSAVGPLCGWLQRMLGSEEQWQGELEFAALALMLRGNLNSAARLFGFLRAREERTPMRRSAMRRDAYELLRSSLGRELDEPKHAAAAGAGALLTFDEAIAEALAALACASDG